MAKFVDAERDADDLAKLVNEDVEVTTRYGDNPKKSYPMLAAEIQVSVDNLSNLYSASIYGSEADGISNTSDGEYFSVASSETASYLDLYKNELGVATYLKTYPSDEEVANKLPIVNTTNLFNKETISQDFTIDTDGTLTSFAGFYASDYIPVKELTQYTHNLHPVQKRHAFYNSEKVFISAGLDPETFTTPANAEFVRVSAKNVDVEPSAYMLVEGDTLPSTYESWIGVMAERVGFKNQANGYAGLNVDGEIALSVIPKSFSLNIFNPLTFTPDEYIDQSGNVVSDNRFFITDFISVSPGETISWSNIGNDKFITLFDIDKNFISTETGKGTWTIGSSLARFAKIAPRYTETPVASFMVVRGSLDELPATYEPYNSSFIELQSRRNERGGYAGINQDGKLALHQMPDSLKYWAGKKIVAIGDSITYGFIPRNVPEYPGQLNSYLPLIAESLGSSFVNYGISGSTLGSDGTDNRQPFTRRYDLMDDDADLVIVMGGTNDFRNNVPIGTMSDRTDLSFYGALHVLCEGLIDKYYNQQGVDLGKSKQIMFMTPLKIITQDTGVLDTAINPYVEAVKEVCDYYSIPVFDLHNLSGITPHILQTVTGTEPGYTGNYNPYITDGTHPTQQGHEKMAGNIAGFINSLK